MCLLADVAEEDRPRKTMVCPTYMGWGIYRGWGFYMGWGITRAGGIYRSGELQGEGGADEVEGLGAGFDGAFELGVLDGGEHSGELGTGVVAHADEVGAGH